jgi:hypothetical protein
MRLPAAKLWTFSSAKTLSDVLDAANSRELADSLTAIAILSAIACLVIVHRAVLARLLTARLVCRKPHCANRSCQDRKQDFEITFHNQPSLAIITKASEIRQR